MELYDAIFKRKSIRKYSAETLTSKELDDVNDFLNHAKALNQSIQIEYEIRGNVKAIKKPNAFHFLLIYSEEKDDYLENAGFIFEQFVLYLTSKNLGSCWIGSAKSDEQKKDKSLVSVIAFGKAADTPFREIDEFKRKSLPEISEGRDERLEAARLAPSSMNAQNWFFVAKSNKIELYQKDPNMIQKALMSRESKINMGIALCHLYYATLKEEKNFIITKGASQSLCKPLN